MKKNSNLKDGIFKAKELGLYEGLDDIIGARPFTEVTREDLKDGEFRKAMVEGLRGRGLDAK